MKILVCGDRGWKAYLPIREKIAHYKPSLVIHGGADGADKLAGIAAKSLGVPVRVVEAEWARYGKTAGPIRNQKMLDEWTPGLVLAFHDCEPSVRCGTRDMITRAREAGVEVLVFNSN